MHVNVSTIYRVTHTFNHTQYFMAALNINSHKDVVIGYFTYFDFILLFYLRKIMINMFITAI